MSDFSRCDYRAAHIKHRVVYGSALTGHCLIMAIKNSQHGLFKGDGIVAWRLFIQMKHTKTNGCARMGDYRLLFSLWNQHRPRPKNWLLLWSSKRCIIVKYWFRKLKDVLLCTTSLKEYSDKGLKEILRGKMYEAVVCFWVELTGRPRETEIQAVLFLIFNASAQVYINML